jgi:hypothetical protein
LDKEGGGTAKRRTEVKILYLQKPLSSTLTDLNNGERGITYATNAQMKNERNDKEK